MLAYFDCFSGVAGDMILGAMLDAGLPLGVLKKELRRLPLHGYTLKKNTERRGVIGGTNLHVELSHHHHHHVSYRDIARMIKASRLGKDVKKMSLEIFDTLAVAEGRIHRKSKRDVHFHEVGDTDSIIDIVGASVGFDYFGFDGIYASRIPMSRGFIKCEHGLMPVPAPAALEIMKGIPLVPSNVKGELVTPTGAAILKTVVRSFGDSPIREIKEIGYGHGDNKYKGLPNSLRLVIGEGERLVVVEANIDDMNPEFYEYVIEELLRAGALDVIVTPAIMKKRRPAACLKVLLPEGLKDRLTKIIFRETSTIGVRSYPVERNVLERRIGLVDTKYGKIRVKGAGLAGETFNRAPEYEDCKRVARLKRVPLKDVYLAALK